MKRFIYILFVLFLLTGLASTAFAGSYYEPNSVRAFDAEGFVMQDDTNPFNRIQEQMDFRFVSGRKVNGKYETTQEDNATYTPGLYKIELELTYDRNLLEDQSEYFITGTFAFTFDSPDGPMTYSGSANGRIVNILHESSVLDFEQQPENPFIVVIDCLADDNSWGYYFMLSTPGTELIALTEYENSSYDSEEFYHHEERAHIPSPSNQADVAAGVGITTAGIVVVNSLTNTSVFGSASFNSAFNPQAAPAVQPTTPSPQAVQGSGGGGFVKSVGDFFKGLFEALRDMLTDEGRSFASGKVTDILQDSDLSD